MVMRIMDPRGGESSDINNSNRCCRRGPNVVIMSAAGKPIFVRYGRSSGDFGGEANEEEWATACGIVQGLRANVLSFGFDGLDKEGASSLGDILSIKAGKRLIVFKHTEALSLVAISDRSDGNHNEAWLSLLLEYAYSQVIFTLTSQVQSIFNNSPSYDLRSMMGPNVNDSIRNLLDRFDPAIHTDDDGCDVSVHKHDLRRKSFNDININHLGRNRDGTGCGSFLTAGVECIHPIPPEIREDASKMLINARGSNGNDLFAMLVVGTRLLTIVQPANPSLQLHTSDLHLILTFVGRQTGLLSNESWFPLCLPRFDSSGFLYAYTSCLDPMDTGLSIVLISPDNNIEQFESFRHTANYVRKELKLRSIKTKVLRVFDNSSNISTTSSVSNPVAGYSFGDRGRRHSRNDLSGISTKSEESKWKKSHFDDAAWTINDDDKDESYIEDDDDDGRGIAQRISSRRRPTFEKRLSSTCYMGNDFLEENSDEDEDFYHEVPLLTALKVALSAKQQEEMMDLYLKLASAVHFVFRCDIYVNSGQSASGGVPSMGSMLSQCFGPPLSFPFTDASSQNRVWDIYQRLSLRLRLGSSSVEVTMDALDTITNAQHYHHNVDSCGISRECPMQRLLESPPNVHSVTYLLEDNEWLFVGLNGKYFELYATLPATIPPKTGTAYCARLVRSLMGDERILFLSNPITWGS
ncbi:hypothetical protein ACHAXA_002447 [Cyclostephanos tholiformis]|uniref:Vacuolar fusion protein MON1 homolog n=1 Tax=Cyclostephanos tholiformis TaxID=382380 RepID=A0ABD3RCR5_9STRA